MEKFNKPETMKNKKRLFISGAITGEEDTYKQKFYAVQLYFEGQEHVVMNPACLPLGFEHADYLQICFKMIDACDAVVFLPDWETSKGAGMEYAHAVETGKPRYLFDEVFKKEARSQILSLIDEKRRARETEIRTGYPSHVRALDYLALDWAYRNLK
jgi:hypothetical protein